MAQGSSSPINHVISVLSTFRRYLPAFLAFWAWHAFSWLEDEDFRIFEDLSHPQQLKAPGALAAQPVDSHAIFCQLNLFRDPRAEPFKLVFVEIKGSAKAWNSSQQAARQPAIVRSAGLCFPAAF